MQVPNRTILKDLVDEALKSMIDQNSYVLWIGRVLSYVLQFDEFITADTRAAHILRQVAKHTELLLTQFISEGSIVDTEGFAVGEIVGDVYSMTSHVAMFDIDNTETDLSHILEIIPETQS